MQALIMGSNGTPYSHGAYLFDIHFEDNYPNGPPKATLTTTGSGQIRFNSNLFACGKICPGFEHKQGTLEGEKKNEAYANIVRYGNVKFPLLENIKNPPKRF
jgi:hypothetical protein